MPWMTSGSDMISPKVMRGIERGIRVLEDEGDFAPVLLEVVALELVDVHIAEVDLPSAGLEQPVDTAAGGRFAASRFAHQAERLPFVHLEGDVVHGFDRLAEAGGDEALPDVEMLLEVLDLEQRCHLRKLSS